MLLIGGVCERAELAAFDYESRPYCECSGAEDWYRFASVFRGL